MPFPADGKVMIHLVLMWLDEITYVEYPTYIATELSMILDTSGHHRPPHKWNAPSCIALLLQWR